MDLRNNCLKFISTFPYITFDIMRRYLVLAMPHGTQGQDHCFRNCIFFMRRDSWSCAQPPTWKASGFGIKVPVLQISCQPRFTSYDLSGFGQSCLSQIGDLTGLMTPIQPNEVIDQPFPFHNSYPDNLNVTLITFTHSLHHLYNTVNIQGSISVIFVRAVQTIFVSINPLAILDGLRPIISTFHLITYVHLLFYFHGK